MVPGFLVTVVNNLPAMQVLQEIQAQSLGQENPLKEEMATHSSSLAWRIPWTRSLAGYSPWGRMHSYFHIHELIQPHIT